jgi:hypothetical protein
MSHCGWNSDHEKCVQQEAHPLYSGGQEENFALIAYGASAKDDVCWMERRNKSGRDWF